MPKKTLIKDLIISNRVIYNFPLGIFINNMRFNNYFYRDGLTNNVVNDFIFEDNGKIKQGGGYTTIPTKNVLSIKKIKV